MDLFGVATQLQSSTRGQCLCIGRPAGRAGVWMKRKAIFHAADSPSALLWRYRSRSFVSASLLLLRHDDSSSSVTSSLGSGSPSEVGDAASDRSGGGSSSVPGADWLDGPSCFPTAAVGAPPSGWLAGLEGAEGLQLPREPSTELGLECSDREGVSGTLMRVHGAP